ncbi:MAG: DUF6602 domain-containing protein [Candidatus Brocadiia bacterium]
MDVSLSEGPGTELRDKLRAESRVLRQRFEAMRAGGRHTTEKGLRNEQVLIDYLRERLPARFGVARGEVMDSRGGLSRQCDVVVYDALHAPMIQKSPLSRVFPSESVYAVIELKPVLCSDTLGKSLEVVESVKALDRSAIVEQHNGHRIYHGPKVNPPPFGAVFALSAPKLGKTLVPTLDQRQLRCPPRLRVDCVCVLDAGLTYYFAKGATREGEQRWVPTVLRRGARLGHYESGEDTLLLFLLFLLYQLNAKELWPPNFLCYVDALGLPEPIPWRLRVG